MIAKLMTTMWNLNSSGDLLTGKYAKASRLVQRRATSKASDDYNHCLPEMDD